MGTKRKKTTPLRKVWKIKPQSRIRTSRKAQLAEKARKREVRDRDLW